MRDMKIDTEKMRLSVLAECETITTGKGNSQDVIGDNHGGFSIRRESGSGSSGFKAWVYGQSFYFDSDKLASDKSLCALLYNLLGLSERAAVEAERAEMMKTVDALSAMVSVDPVSFAELEAKNAALVAALESLKRAVGYKPRRHGEIVLYRNDLGVFIDNALAANENGGVQG